MKRIALLPMDLSLLGLLLLCTTFMPAPKPEVHTIEISQMQFRPAVLEAHAGDTIVFVNKDLVQHNATELSGKSWKSPTLASGDSWRMVITKSASYYCSFHPVMKGKIEVK